MARASVTQVTLVWTCPMGFAPPNAAYADRPTPRTGGSPASDPARLRPLGRQDPRHRRHLARRRTARRCSPSRGATARAAGPSGRRASSSARRCCSSTRPATTQFLDLGRARTLERMAPHLTHIGVHDHGFNNVSTYGNLWRLAREGRIDAERVGSALLRAGAEGQRRGAGAALDADCRDGGFIYSFNGAHSLFVDTIRSLRALALGAPARPAPDGGAGRAASACSSACVDHARATAQYNVYFGARPRRLRRPRAHRAREPVQRRQRHLSRPEHAAGLLAVHAPGRAAWPGRCSASPSSSSSSTTLPTGSNARRPTRHRCDCSRPRARPAITTSTRPPADGIPYWDTGAPGLAALADWRDRPPIRSTITSRSTAPPPRSRAQGLLRLGRLLDGAGDGPRPTATGRPACRVVDTLFDDGGPYLSADPAHQGLLLHSVYHWPNGWDHVPAGRRDAARRIEPVGRLPRARSRALRASASPRTGRT